MTETSYVHQFDCQDVFNMTNVE